MPHIHTNPGQHDITASAFIVIEGDPPLILMHWHKKIHKWLQFGGHVELHENPWDAVCHEIMEESGYKMKDLKVLQPKLRIISTDNSSIQHPVPVGINTHPFGMGIDHYHTDIAYAFTAKAWPKGQVDEGESTVFKTFTIKELEALDPEDIPPSTRDNAVFIMKHLLKKWEALPLPS